MTQDTEPLVETDKYLKTGAHIGTRYKSGDMVKYIYKVRRDGLKVMDIETIDKRIKIVAKFLAKYDPKKIIVVSRKLYGQETVKIFAETIGAVPIFGRFIPGTLTNPIGKKFLEAEVLVATEPEPDAQAIKEASAMRIPVIALASTNNSLSNVDLVIPVNNKGRKSLALVYWLLAREILINRGEIKKPGDFKIDIEDFEYKMKEGETEEKETMERGWRQAKFAKRKGPKSRRRK